MAIYQLVVDIYKFSGRFRPSLIMALMIYSSILYAAFA